MGSGEYELDQHGRRCFRPFVPTPPRLEDVVDLVERAADSIGKFDRAVAAWSDPALVGRLFARLDAVHSSGAEGSTTTFTDLLQFQSALKRAPDVRDAASVAACADALDDPVDRNLIKTTKRLHARLFESSADIMASSKAGELKTFANATANEDAPGGLFFYTKSESVLGALRDWQAFTLEVRLETPELVRQALSHWMFEHIHPTHDGNGRIGRLLTPLMLREKGVTHSVCAFFSEAVHEEKQLYVEALKKARETGDMTGWVRLMMMFLERTAGDNLNRIVRLAALRDDWRGKISRFRSDSVIHRLLPFVLIRPAFTISDALAVCGGTFATVNLATRRLVDLGVLSAAETSERNRLFLARAVLEIFDRFAERDELQR